MYGSQLQSGPCCSVLQFATHLCIAMCCSVGPNSNQGPVAVCCACNTRATRLRIAVCCIVGLDYDQVALYCSLQHSEWALPSDPMNHAKIFKVPPRLFPLWKLIPNWYKLIPSSPDHICQEETNHPTILSNKTSAAKSCGEHQILEHLMLCTRFVYLYWMMS